MRLAEKIIPNKLYCPAPSCSVFIHERHIPTQVPSTGSVSLKDVFIGVLDKVNLSTAARFFRTSELQKSLPDYYAKVREHVDLNTIRERVEKGT